MVTKEDRSLSFMEFKDLWVITSVVDITFYYMLSLHIERSQKVFIEEIVSN